MKKLLNKYKKNLVYKKRVKFDPMGGAPDKEEGQCKHGKTTVDTFGIPKVIVKVGVPLPEAEIRGHF